MERTSHKFIYSSIIPIFVHQILSQGIRLTVLGI